MNQLVKISFALLVLGVLEIGCAPPSQQQSVAVGEFNGIEDLRINPDGTWTIDWPVALGTDVQYLLYRALEGEEMDYSQARWSSGTQNNYITEQLTFLDPYCYVVRMTSLEIISDGNENVRCTTQTRYVWEGVKEISRDEKTGEYLVEWDSVAVADPKYKIYQKEKFNEYTDPIAIKKESSFLVGLPPRGHVYCYQVSFLDELGDREVCTELDEKLSFTGIDAITYTSDTESINVIIKTSQNPDVVGYRLYSGPERSLLLKEILIADVSVAEDVQKRRFSQNGIIQNEVYVFTVRAFDKYGREDRNLRQLSLRGGEVNIYDTDDGLQVVGISGVESRSKTVNDSTIESAINITLINDATDGVISKLQRIANMPMVSVSDADQLFSVAFSVILFSEACQSDLIYLPDPPTSKIAGFGTNDTYKVCVRIILKDNSFSFVESDPIILDTLAPPPANVVGSPGKSTDTILVTIDYSSNTSDYEKAELRRLAGYAAPADCNSGTVIATFQSFKDSTYLDKTVNGGSVYSYALCLYDSAGNSRITKIPKIIARSKHLIFSTSASFGGDLGGLVGADQKCQTAAEGADLQGAWRAILSDLNTNASSRLNIRGKIYNFGGALVANDQADLWGGVLVLHWTIMSYEYFSFQKKCGLVVLRTA